MSGGRANRPLGGDDGNFAEIYDEFGDRLYHYLLGWVRNAAAAEDLLQTVMLRVVRYRRKVPGIGNLKAWLYTLARNEARRHHAKAIRRGRMFGEAAIELFVAPKADADEEGLLALRAAIARLTPERYEVVSLKLYQQLTFAEIGEVLGISPNTAASRYRYALEDLRKMLEASDERQSA